MIELSKTLRGHEAGLEAGPLSPASPRDGED